MLTCICTRMHTRTQVEKGAGAAYLRFRKEAAACLAVGNDHFIYKDSDNLLGLIPPPDALLKLAQSLNPISLLSPHISVLSSYFKDPRIKAMFSFQVRIVLFCIHAHASSSLLSATRC